MGLDQYAYVASQAGEEAAHWDHYGEDDSDQYPQPRQLAYWRKHPNLQGWMHSLWVKKGCPGVDKGDGESNPMFNGVELELTWDDIEDLERAITHGMLPQTTGFFFGDNSDEYYQKQDLEFVRQAKTELFCGLRVFYNSSW